MILVNICNERECFIIPFKVFLKLLSFLTKTCQFKPPKTLLDFTKFPAGIFFFFFFFFEGLHFLRKLYLKNLKFSRNLGTGMTGTDLAKIEQASNSWWSFGISPKGELFKYGPK